MADEGSVEDRHENAATMMVDHPSGSKNQATLVANEPGELKAKRQSQAQATNPDSGRQGINVLSAFQTHQRALKRFIGRYLNSVQDIEDVTQEAFMRAYSAEKTTQVRQPKSFLFRIAKNVAISELRKKANQITDSIEEQSSTDVLVNEWSTEDEVMAQEKLDIHCEAVATLPPKCRQVYLLRKVYGLSHKEISAKLGIASSTVEKHLMKGVEDCDRFIEMRMAQVNQQQQSTNSTSPDSDWYYQGQTQQASDGHNAMQSTNQKSNKSSSSNTTNQQKNQHKNQNTGGQS